MDRAQGKLLEKTVKSSYSKGEITVYVFFILAHKKYSRFTHVLLYLCFPYPVSAHRLYSRTHSEEATTS
jgi:hypothetical protein